MGSRLDCKPVSKVSLAPNLSINISRFQLSNALKAATDASSLN